MRQVVLATATAALLAVSCTQGELAAAASSPNDAPAGHLSVLTEPAAGLRPIYGFITGAKHSVNLTMYELRDTTAESDLAADAAHGVDVRVILDQNLEKSRNRAAYSYLAAHGVHVHWADPTYDATHQKTFTVDGTTSVIMTLNLVPEDYPDTRDFAVVDTDPADVAAITTTFTADFAGRADTSPTGTDLVWSPTNARAEILSIIDGANHTLAVENEEMAYSPVTEGLEAAARRGVNVEVTMTANQEYDRDFSSLVTAGVHVRTYNDADNTLYIHAKAIVADAGLPGQAVLVGSENFSSASLNYNRELGILTTNPAVATTVNTTLVADFAGATPYGPPANCRPSSLGTRVRPLYGLDCDPSPLFFKERSALRRKAANRSKELDCSGQW